MAFISASTSIMTKELILNLNISEKQNWAFASEIGI